MTDYEDPDTGKHEILAAGRLSKLNGVNEAEFSMLVSDRYQGKGIGTEMLRRLLQMGRDAGLSKISADILPENRAMQHVCQKLGFHVQRTISENSEPMVKATISL